MNDLNKINNFNKLRKSITTTAISLLTAIVFLSVLPHLAPVEAISLTPSIYEIQIEAGSSTKGSLTVSNDETKTFFGTVTPINYNPVTRVQSTENIFVKITNLSTNEIALPVGGSKTIEYEITVPETTKPGSYFNLILISSKDQQNTATSSENTNISYLYSIGGMVAIHVNNNVLGVNYSDSFKKNTLTTIEVIGDPLTVDEIVFVVKFQNNSSYAYTPIGGVVYFDKSEQGKREIFQYNDSQDKVYANETHEESYKVASSKEIAKLLSTKQITATLQELNDDTTNYITTYEFSSILFRALLIGLFGLIVAIIATSIISPRRKRKTESTSK